MVNASPSGKLFNNMMSKHSMCMYLNLTIYAIKSNFENRYTSQLLIVVIIYAGLGFQIESLRAHARRALGVLGEHSSTEPTLFF